MASWLKQILQNNKVVAHMYEIRVSSNINNVIVRMINHAMKKHSFCVAPGSAVPYE